MEVSTIQQFFKLTKIISDCNDISKECASQVLFVNVKIGLCSLSITYRFKIQLKGENSWKN